MTTYRLESLARIKQMLFDDDYLPLPGNPVAVLFARSDSVYKILPGTDVYDESRDARTFSGNQPVVAHPPCRAWGRLRHFANPAPHEKDLARFAVGQVRRCGGVLEHPAYSTLWLDQCLPVPGRIDRFGGFTLPVSQSWFGHKAEKMTWLYICGIQWRDLPVIPLHLGASSHVVCPARAGMGRPSISKAEREETPMAFAHWLLEVARLCVPAVVGNASHLAQPSAKASPSDTGLLSTAETFTPFSALLQTEQETCL